MRAHPAQTVARGSVADLEAEDVRIRLGLLLVHSHELLAGSLSVALAAEPGLDVVAVEIHPTDGLLRLLAAEAEVVLVDNTSVAARIHQEHPTLLIVVLGASDDPGVVLACIRSGAVACANERVSPGELANVVRRVHAGDVVYEPSVLRLLLQRPSISMAAAPRRTAQLSERELDVLRVIVKGATSAEAADILGISLNTLRTHLKNIVAKMNARSRVEAVIIAIREGRIDLTSDEG